MIPKIIHYIWLGGKEEPKLLQKCKESWKKYCPDYEIKRWDESNLDMDKYKYAKDAIAAKKYAFAADVFRFEILKLYGGIYVDVDVEFLKPIDEFLDCDAFTGFETKESVAPGLLFGSEINHPIMQEMLDYYEKNDFNNDLKNNITICKIFTKLLVKKGLVLNNKTQQLENIKIYASEYFCPINIITNRKKITKNTVSIHWYDASWFSPKQKAKQRIKKVLNFCSFGLFGKIVQKIKK